MIHVHAMMHPKRSETPGIAFIFSPEPATTSGWKINFRSWRSMMSIFSYFRNRRRAHLGARDLLQMSEDQLRDLGIEPGQAADVAARMITAHAEERPAPPP